MAADESFDSAEMETNRENTDDLLAVQLSQTPDNDEGFRPLLADAQKIGFFSLDRTTQTNTTEILDIKELTETIEQLLEDSSNMRRDINFARSVMQAEFDAKLEHKAIELYHRVNEKIGEIERMHEERVGTVRRAFRQQLSDALVRVQSLHNQNMDEKINKERKKKDKDKDRWEIKFKELQSTIQRNESIIQVLKMQLSQYQEKEEDEDDWLLEDELKSDENEGELLSFRSKSTKTPSINAAQEEEMEELKAEMAKMERHIDRLQDALDIKEKDSEDLSNEIDGLNQQLEKERIMSEQHDDELRFLRTEHNRVSQANTLINLRDRFQRQSISHDDDQLNQEKEDMVNSVQSDAHSSKRAMEDQRTAWETELVERVQRAKEEALAEARAEAEEAGASDREVIKRLMDEKRMAEQLLSKERAKANEKTKDELDLEKARKTEATLLSQISRLKKEIDRVHKTWEKKFAILQQSLHALKDESYLRQTMQKQAAQLHQASISYAMDTPQGIVPVRSQAMPPMSPQKKPLPHIKNQKVPQTPPDYISYTVSAPSGRATTLFSADGHFYPSYPPRTAGGGGGPSPRTAGMYRTDLSLLTDSAFHTGSGISDHLIESASDNAKNPKFDSAVYFAEEDQIMSDGELDLPDDILVLPGPPDSRASTRSQIIVVPNS